MKAYDNLCRRCGASPESELVKRRFYEFYQGLETYCQVLNLDIGDERVQEEYCEYVLADDYWAWLDARAAINNAMRGAHTSRTSH